MHESNKYNVKKQMQNQWGTTFTMSKRNNEDLSMPVFIDTKALEYSAQSNIQGWMKLEIAAYNSLGENFWKPE